VISFAVMPKERKILHKRIAQRYQIMLQQGFVDEVRRLFARGDLHQDLPSIRCVGYRQVWQYLHGEIDYEEMVERGIIATRQLAKRQVTWLRSWPDLHWLDTENPNLLQSALKILP
jgi:tRNA dimethylallyltransferase